MSYLCSVLVMDKRSKLYLYEKIYNIRYKYHIAICQL